MPILRWKGLQDYYQFISMFGYKFWGNISGEAIALIEGREKGSKIIINLLSMFGYKFWGNISGEAIALIEDG